VLKELQYIFREENEGAVTLQEGSSNDYERVRMDVRKAAFPSDNYIPLLSCINNTTP